MKLDYLASLPNRCAFSIDIHVSNSFNPRIRIALPPVEVQAGEKPVPALMRQVYLLMGSLSITRDELREVTFTLFEQAGDTLWLDVDIALEYLTEFFEADCKAVREARKDMKIMHRTQVCPRCGDDYCQTTRPHLECYDWTLVHQVEQHETTF